MTRRILTGALGLGLALATLGACSDDDDEATDDEYCELAREMASNEDIPSDETLDEYVEAAPDEIKDEAELAADAIKADGPAAFDDPEVVAAIEDIEAFEEAECGIVAEDPGDDDTGDTTEDTLDGTGDEPTDDGVDGDTTTSTILEGTVTTPTG